MTTEFTQFGLHPQLVQAVAERGYTAPTPIQEAVIPAMLAGVDVIGQAQTGTGKTAAFALPILHRLVPGESHVQALVLAPTRELALQVANAVSSYGQFMGVRVLPVYGGQAYGPQIRQLRQGVDVVVGAPGRLLDLIKREVLDLSQVRTVVLDEADEMLSMGFIEDIQAILEHTPAERQTTLFSATLPTEIRRLADRYLREPQSISIRAQQLTVETIEQRAYLVHRADKLAALTRLFEVEDISSALIFVRTRGETGELAKALTLRGFPAEALSGELSQDARERTLGRFRQNQIKVLVATDVAARGLDIDAISHVFNYDLPDDAEVYVHRVGRTARAGKSGVAISFVAPSEKRRLGQIEAFTRRKMERAALPTEEDIKSRREARLIGQVNMWLNRGRYRRERELIEQLVQEGHDPLDIAAAALKLARAEEKQRPIAAISAPVEDRPAAGRGFNRPDDRGITAASHEAGMVRLSLNLGRRNGVNPNDIVGAIARHADIPGRALGKIFIQERSSFVDVPEALVPKVLAVGADVRIRRQPVVVQVA